MLSHQDGGRDTRGRLYYQLKIIILRPNIVEFFEEGCKSDYILNIALIN